MEQKEELSSSHSEHLVCKVKSFANKPLVSGNKFYYLIIYLDDIFFVTGDKKYYMR